MPKIILLLSIVFLSGCTGPLALVGQIYGGADTASTIVSGKGVVDNMVSDHKGMDCRIHRVFKDEPMCKELPLSELGERMWVMNCHTYGFDDDDRPYCKEKDLDEIFGQ
jgi:hypothetical protein